jgi:excisionase family DNA binding protein
MSFIPCEGSSTAMQMPLQGYRDLLSVKDLSELLGVSTQTAIKEIRNGRFGEPLKFGREYRIPKVYILQRYFPNSWYYWRGEYLCDIIDVG